MSPQVRRLSKPAGEEAEGAWVVGVRPAHDLMVQGNEDIPVEVLIEAIRRPEVIEAVRAFYKRVDRLVAAQAATCRNRGACCSFGQYGHRLYATALEVCFYLATGEGPPPVTDDRCPHAYEGKCHARDRRPMGCRVFFCDPETEHWQGPLTETLLARLRRLHTKLNVPYFYAEWLTVLRAVNIRCARGRLCSDGAPASDEQAASQVDH